MCPEEVTLSSNLSNPSSLTTPASQGAPSLQTPPSSPGYLLSRVHRQAPVPWLPCSLPLSVASTLHHCQPVNPYVIVVNPWSLSHLQPPAPGDCPWGLLTCSSSSPQHALCTQCPPTAATGSYKAAGHSFLTPCLFVHALPRSYLGTTAL